MSDISGNFLNAECTFSTRTYWYNQTTAIISKLHTPFDLCGLFFIYSLVIPLRSITTETIAKDLLKIASFGAQVYIITDRRHQFEFNVFSELSCLLGWEGLLKLPTILQPMIRCNSSTNNWNLLWDCSRASIYFYLVLDSFLLLKDLFQSLQSC